MMIETGCSGCGRRLRVSDEHAGKLARCPNCNTIYRVPSPDGPVASPDEFSATMESPRNQPRQPTPTPTAAVSPGSGGAPSGASGMWRMRTPEGQVYGPVPRHELNSWVREGRVSSDCELRENDGDWTWADRIFPELARVGSASRSSQSRGDGTLVLDDAYYVPPPNTLGRVPGDRGALILALGIMGWIVLCPFLSLAAWIMGSHDLREMRAGRMSTSGMGMTQAGVVLAVVHVIGAGLLITLALAAAVG